MMNENQFLTGKYFKYIILFWGIIFLNTDHIPVGIVYIGIFLTFFLKK